MSRFLPLALIPFLAVSAWRRETDVPKSADRRGQAPRTDVFSIIEEGDVAAPRAAATAVRVAVRADAEEREQKLQERIVALETALQEALQKVDEHRAKLAKALNRRGPDPVAFLTGALMSSQERVMELEAQLEVLETAHVVRVAPLRRSD